jgi:hypothetical protein
VNSPCCSGHLKYDVLSRPGDCPVQVQAEAAQPLRLFTAALLVQQPGQPLADERVVGVGPGAQLVQLATVGQQVSQPGGRSPVADVGPAA